MLATKPINQTNPPVSMRLDEETYDQLEKMTDRYPLFSRSQMLLVALKYWLVDALKYGVDTNLQPLKPKGKG